MWCPQELRRHSRFFRASPAARVPRLWGLGWKVHAAAQGTQLVREVLCIGTNFGHADKSNDLDAINLLRVNEKIRIEDRERILSGNPACLVRAELG